MHLQHADLVAAPRERVHRLVHGLGARPHDDDDALGFGIARILEQAVPPARERRESRHQLLHDIGTGAIEEVGRFAGLEERIGVLRGSPQHGMVRRQRPPAVGRDLLFRHQRPQVVVGELLDLRDLVRRSKAVEEMQEWYARVERRRVRDGREVVRLLHARSAEHREASGPAGHDVGMVAENGQRVGGDGARRDVHREGGQLSRDLEHVGDHQEQALRRREGRRQRAGLQRAVHRSRGTRLRLHLDDVRDVAPEVASALIRPFVGELAHRRRGRDRINRDHFAHAVRDRRGRFVAVQRHRPPTGHRFSPGNAEAGASHRAVEAPHGSSRVTCSPLCRPVLV